MDIFVQIAKKIIEEQETIVGPIAPEQANRVSGLRVNWPKREVIFEENNYTDIIEKLIERYKGLFGEASLEVCREAVKGIISQVPQDKIPPLLR